MTNAPMLKVLLLLPLVASIALASPALAQSCPTHAPNPQEVNFIGSEIAADLPQESYNVCYSPFTNGQATSCLVGETITFRLVTNPPGLAVEACDAVHWNFDDGTSADSYGASPVKHAYVNGGYYSPTYKISNSKGSVSNHFSVTVADRIRFSLGAVTVQENAGVAHIGLTRTGSLDSVTVDCYTNDQTAHSGVRYAFTHHTVTFVAGQPTATFDVPLVNDSVYLGTQSFLVGIIRPSSFYESQKYKISFPNLVTVQILDDEGPGSFAFSSPLYTAAENSGNATITVTRSGGAGTVAVNYATHDTNAAPAVTPASGTLTFGDHELSKTFTLAINNDLDATGDRQVTLELSAPTNGATLTAGGSTSVLRVIEDDAYPALQIDSVVIAEGNLGAKNATFNVSIPPLTRSLNVNYTTENNTALAGSDYQATSGTLAFAAGETWKTINVPIFGDEAPEPHETFSVVLSMTCCPSALAPPAAELRGTGMILNDDYLLSPANLFVARGSKGQFTLSFGTIPPSDSAISIASSDTSIFTVAVGFPWPSPGQSATLEVAGIAPGKGQISVKLPPELGGGTLNSGVTVYERATLTFDPPTVVVAAGATANVTIHLAPAPGSPTTLAAAANDPSITEVPAKVTFDAAGNATLTVKGLSVGTALVGITLPPSNGGGTTYYRVQVVGASAGPHITALSPANGPMSGGTTVTILGENFNDSCVVYFGNVAAQRVALSGSTAMTVISPPHVNGMVAVTMSCGESHATDAASFTYVDPKPSRSRGVRH
jgi:hypothetical protein